MGNRGFTIIEVLIATALMGIAAMGMTQLFVGQNRQLRTVQVKANLDQLRNVVQNSAKDPDTILYTAQKTDPAAGGAAMNPQLANCVFSTGPNDLNLDCKEGWTPAPVVRLFSRDGHEVTGFYTSNGVHCATSVTATSVTCPFQVSATFRPACPVNTALTIAGLCARAQTIQIGWIIEQKTELPNFPHQKTIQADFVDSTSSAYSVPVSTQNIQATASVAVECPPITLTAAMLTTASPIPPGKFDAVKYNNLVGEVFPQTVTSVDAYGQQVCGIDQGALDAESLKTEVCKLWVQNAWKGVTADYIQTTVPTCDIQVVKNLKMAGVAGALGRMTNDCNVASGNYRLYHGGGVIANAYQVTGGIMQHMNGVNLTAAEVTTAVNMYALPPADSSTLCQFKKITPHNPGAWYSDTTFLLGPDYQPGSFIIDLQGGGGGGGAAHGSPTRHGGNGGAAGAHVKNKVLAVSAGQTCVVNVGGGGNGAGNSSCATGSNGGDTKIDCAGVVAVAPGGGGRDCGGSNGGKQGDSSDFGAGGSGGGCGVGGAAGFSSYGAGGGGGGTSGCYSSHSGGNGREGRALATWNDLTWPEWSGTPNSP